MAATTTTISVPIRTSADIDIDSDTEERIVKQGENPDSIGNQHHIICDSDIINTEKSGELLICPTSSSMPKTRNSSQLQSPGIVRRQKSVGSTVRGNEIRSDVKIADQKNRHRLLEVRTFSSWSVVYCFSLVILRYHFVFCTMVSNLAPCQISSIS